MKKDDKMMFKKMILILIILLDMCILSQNIKAQQDSCLYMNPIFAEELSKIYRQDNVFSGNDTYHLLRFFKLGSNLYFTMGHSRTFPSIIDVQDDNKVYINANCIYYYLINGHNVLINDYCSSTGYGLYFPCQITNKQALIEKSTSPIEVSLDKHSISYYLTYQVLQDSIIRVPLIIPAKYEEDEEFFKLTLVERDVQINREFDFPTAPPSNFVGNYLNAQDTCFNALIERINILRVLDQARFQGYTKNEELLCAMQYPKVSYFKKIETKGFYGYKFYVCRFEETRYDCSSDDVSLCSYIQKTGSIKYVFAISDEINNKKIYRIAGFKDKDFQELVCDTYNGNLKNHLKCKKQFLKNYYIEGVDMKLLYGDYKAKKKCR